MLKKNKIIINSIVFKDHLSKGVTQTELLDHVYDLGFERFEVRREFLRDSNVELVSLKNRAEQLGMELFYSANVDLLVESKLNPLLETLLIETRLIGASFLKLNIGDATRITQETLLPLDKILPEDICLFVENNQDPFHASITNCYQFMSIVSQTDFPINFVFDTANWAFIGESLIQALNKMSSFTKYVHCKNYHNVNGILKNSVSLFDGEINIEKLLKSFSKNSYVALEYATSKEQLILDSEKLQRIFDEKVY